jgi:phage protein U
MATAFVDTLLQSLDSLQRRGGSVSQHALLGNVAFNLITYFEGIETKFAADYAEHALLEGKPRLQWTGDKLDEIRWDVVFHAGFCDPETELLKLRQIVADHKAMPLVFANGDHKGYFVVTEASVTSRQLLRDGGAVWIEVKLTLREYVEPVSLVERQAATAAEKPAKGSPKKPAKTRRRTPPARTSDQPTRSAK